MECIEAQQILSEAADGAPVDAAILAAARQHCSSCAECARFSAAIDAVASAQLPTPADDLHDRIMQAIRAEAALAAAPTTVATPPADAADDEAAAALAGATGRQRRDRQRVLAWVGAAAVLLVVAGVSTGLGVLRFVGGGARTAAPASSEMAKVTADGTAADLSAAGSAAAPEAVPPNANPGSPSALYAVWKDAGYQLIGVTDVAQSELTTAGTLAISFSADQDPVSRTVYTTKEAAVFFVRDDEGALQRFSAVTRVYKNVQYTLRSAPIESFSSWPTLPETVPHPVPENNPDGSPVFTLDGQDANGTNVYHRLGADERTGIAIAPGTGGADPSAGNPNWTWWTP
ncbi:MAG: hypothetical protein HGB10_03105 [Coriobacteriia bacterium]|nr:hypothetical protein [Coriobacteriia bacterium]